MEGFITNREISGLIEALETFKLKEGLIITYNQADILRVGSKTIKVLPAWKWGYYFWEIYMERYIML